MNYIKEINSFYDWLETNSVSDSAITLWHALMHINNKTGWKVEFTVAVSTLQVKTSLSSSSLKRARNTLAQAGLIRWKQRGGNQSAVYEIVSFAVQYEPQSAPQSVPQSEPQSVPQSEPINKLNKTKQDNILLEKESKDDVGDFEDEEDIKDLVDQAKKVLNNDIDEPPQKRKKVALKKEKENLVMPENFIPIWKEWLQYRKARKFKSYAAGEWEQKAVDKLLEYSNNDPETAKEILNNTYQNNYQGFFPLKQNNNGKSGNYQSSINGTSGNKNKGDKVSGTKEILSGARYTEFT